MNRLSLDHSTFSKQNGILNLPNRNFAYKAKGKKKDLAKPKPKFVKPIDVDAYSATKEPIIQLENGYYLLYYHRQRAYTMILLYLKLIIPLLLVLY